MAGFPHLVLSTKKRSGICMLSQSNIRSMLPGRRSALGRSSIYNRVQYIDRQLFVHLGFTRGSGEFHFANGDYQCLYRYAIRYCEATERKRQWGNGFRNRREVIRKCLSRLSLPRAWLRHGIEREVFAVPLARNTRQFLRGEHSKLLWYGYPADELFAFFRERFTVVVIRTPAALVPPMEAYTPEE